MALVLETSPRPLKEHATAYWNTKMFRRALVLIVGCGVMAMSGGGLAGYLDLSSATAAPGPSADAAPLD